MEKLYFYTFSYRLLFVRLLCPACIQTDHYREAPRKVEPYIISQLDRYFVRDWKYVVIHHSASPTGCATEFDKYHREKKVGKMDWDIIL